MTILNQYEILKNVTPIWFSIVFLFLLACVIGSLIYIFSSHNTISAVAFCIFIIAIFLCAIWCSVVYEIVHREDAPTGRYRYECIIDDDTSFVDISEKYVVVEQRGEIWVLEDKED